jgi:hypothetical protein
MRGEGGGGGGEVSKGTRKKGKKLERDIERGCEKCEREKKGVLNC